MPRDEYEGKDGGDDMPEGLTQMEEAFELLSMLPGGGDSTSILDRAAAWFGVEKKKGRKRFKLLEEFLDENCAMYEDADRNVDESIGDGSGMPMEWHDCHCRYMKLFEKQLTWFIEQENSSLEAFYAECDDALRGKSTTIFEDEDLGWFVDALLSSMDYGKFHELMWKRARAALHASKKKGRKK